LDILFNIKFMFSTSLSQAINCYDLCRFDWSINYFSLLRWCTIIWLR